MGQEQNQLIPSQSLLGPLSKYVTINFLTAVLTERTHNSKSRGAAQFETTKL